MPLFFSPRLAYTGKSQAKIKSDGNGKEIKP
jgi:hypothetical protein